jgi:hypothetical protein
VDASGLAKIRVLRTLAAGPAKQHLGCSYVRRRQAIGFLRLLAAQRQAGFFSAPFGELQEKSSQSVKPLLSLSMPSVQSA